MAQDPIIPPELAKLRREFRGTGWHIWQGVAGLWYARKLNSSPPIVFRAEDPDGLAAQIRAWQASR